MEILSFNIPAGETKVFERGGTYLEVIDAPGSLNIELQAADGSQADEMRGALSGFYSGEAFASLQISNPETYAQTVRLMVSSRSGGSRRQPGTVQVVDGERNKVLTGVCFRGVSQVIGNQAAIELWNPAGSGKNLFVQAIRAGAASADSWGVQTTDLQFATAGSTPSNLDRSGPAAVALMRTGDASTATNPRGHGAGYLAASTDVVIMFQRPLLVRPGFGALVYVNSAANTLRATFEWEEWALT